MDNIMLLILKSERVWNGYTQEDIAKKLQIEQQTYSKYEKGKLKPSLETIIKLSELYKVPTDYLLGINVTRIDIAKRNAELGDKKGAEIADEILNKLGKKRVRNKKEKEN